MKSFSRRLIISALAFAAAGFHRRAFAHDEVPLKRGEELIVSQERIGGKKVSLHRLRKTAEDLQLRFLRRPDSAFSVFGRSRPFGAQSISEGLVLESKTDLLSLCAAIKKLNPGIFCEINHIYFAGALPNDPGFNSQWGLSKISAPAAWGATTGSPKVKVGIVDTGVAYDHADLAANIAKNGADAAGNHMDDDKNGCIDDANGCDLVGRDGDPRDLNMHGTHVAGIIGAGGNNRSGITGVNWQVGMVPVRVLDRSGSGTSERVAAGIDYAVKRGVQVINLSLGGPEFSRAIENSIGRAAKAGTLIVIAAGNDGKDNDRNPSYPANSMRANVISVAATDRFDRLAPFSNYGVRKVDLAAPGVDILSTVPNNKYASLSGTSMATPFVAGAAALIKAAYPALSVADVKKVLLKSVDPLPSLSGKVASGGRLNVAKALSMAGKLKR